MKKSKVIILFFLVHVIIITSGTVYVAYDVYLRKITGLWHRTSDLSDMYQELLKYKEQNGQFPQTIDSLWRTDEEGEVFFGSQESPFGSEGITRIQYKIINTEPVLIDLGDDNKEGGVGWDWDVTYPKNPQELSPFPDFVNSKYFPMALFQGLIVSSLISLCLYRMWIKGLPAEHVSWLRIIFLVGTSIVFLAFEAFLSEIVLFMHIFPTH